MTLNMMIYPKLPTITCNETFEKYVKAPDSMSSTLMISCTAAIRWSETMFDITDAAESSRTIMMGLNREWIKKQGDFFVESPINFVTAIFWFLKKYKNGKYCSLPHSIELMQVEYEKLFPVLRSIPEIEVLINPFITAFENDAMEQLEGQVGSCKNCRCQAFLTQIVLCPFRK